MADHTDNQRTLVIAEAGVNHNGSVDMALQLVDAAKAAGADAVKFQAYGAERLAARSAPMADYQKASRATSQQAGAHQAADHTQLAMLQELELNAEEFAHIAEYCTRVGITFLASPFDETAAAMLAALGVSPMKIPSGEITNLPLLRYIGALRCPVILSTGMSWLAEVETAVRVLREAGSTDITLLHCVTEYPTPPEQVNLRAMTTLATAFGLPVGYSDHTEGIEIAIAATALGATVIEKHLTLDTTLPGPDHRSSLEPAEFGRMVEAIRRVELALGDGLKRPAPVEVPNIVVARKSLVSARDLEAGRRLEASDLVVKRPGSGIPPQELERVVGRTLAADVSADQVLGWGDLV